MNPPRTFQIGLLVSALACTLGCSNEPRLYVVQGQVSFDGQPVGNGDILFASPAGDRGPDPGQIKDGRYEVKTTKGAKRVEISASKIRPGGARGAGGEPVAEEYIPERYNAQSQLTADVQPNDANVFDFELKSQP